MKYIDKVINQFRSGTQDAEKKENHLSLGKRGEEIACCHLLKNGYRILRRNYRTRLGEIDIIAEEKGTLVFVEVKTRRSHSFGGPFEAVGQEKCRQISRVALQYLEKEGKQNQPARFDVVGVMLPQDSQPQIETIKNAFDLSLGY